jgi:predicted aspartyl protease
MPRRASPERRATPPSRRPIAMGITTLDVDIANLAKPTRTQRVRFIVDSGATYSVVPAPVLRRLGMRPIKRQVLELADGRTVSRRKGAALFRFRDYVGVTDVIFGDKGDATLLGVLTLEALGLALDPIKRALRPVTLFM